MTLRLAGGGTDCMYAACGTRGTVHDAPLPKDPPPTLWVLPALRREGFPARTSEFSRKRNLKSPAAAAT